jgi:hypothetical protein
VTRCEARAGLQAARDGELWSSARPLKEIARGRGITLFRLVTLCSADPEEQAGRSKSAGISARDIPVIAVPLTAKTASNPPLPIAWS